MSEPDAGQVHAPLYLCMMAEEHDEAMMDIMALAREAQGVDPLSARNALLDIHEIVSGYLKEE